MPTGNSMSLPAGGRPEDRAGRRQQEAGEGRPCGGKAGRKRRHFLRPQAPEEAGAQLSELHKNERQTVLARSWWAPEKGLGWRGGRTWPPSG